MIYDKIENCAYYNPLGARFEAALRFLAENRDGKLACGRYDIIPGEVYANVREYDLNEGGQVRSEAHKKFADIQYVFSGFEYLGVSFTCEMDITEPYDEEKDVAFYFGKYDLITLNAEKFAILFPQDAHAVKIAPSGGSHIKKAVIKVLLD